MAVQQDHRWPCDSCGADLRFDPSRTRLRCEHCGSEQKLAPTPSPSLARAFDEQDLARGLRQDLPAQTSAETRSTRCPNCGALVAFQGANHARDCAFCDTPVVVDTGSQRRLKPQALLPFALTQTQARDSLKRWLGSLWFAPNPLLQYTRAGREMTGIYLPFWTFDAATRSHYTGQRGDHYTETRAVTVSVNGGHESREQTVQKTRWSLAAGQVERRFNDVIVLGSTSLPPHLGEALTDWDLTKLKPYSPDYLAGFQAESHTVPLATANQTAHQIMTRQIETDVRRDIGGDAQRITCLDTEYTQESFKHILLPVWVAAYNYRGKTYRFVVNGDSGELRGERPYSRWKIGFTLLALAALGLGALYLNDPALFN